MFSFMDWTIKESKGSQCPKTFKKPFELSGL